MHRPASLAVATVVLIAGLAALMAFGSRGDLPVCEGLYSSTIDYGSGSGFPTLHEAAAQALEVSFDVSVGIVDLRHLGAHRFAAVEIDGSTIDPLPTVSIQATPDGWLAEGVSC
jgi:hypothetical protein